MLLPKKLNATKILKIVEFPQDGECFYLWFLQERKRPLFLEKFTKGQIYECDDFQAS